MIFFARADASLFGFVLDLLISPATAARAWPRTSSSSRLRASASDRPAICSSFCSPRPARPRPSRRRRRPASLLPSTDALLLLELGGASLGVLARACRRRALSLRSPPRACAALRAAPCSSSSSSALRLRAASLPSTSAAFLIASTSAFAAVADCSLRPRRPRARAVALALPEPATEHRRRR